MELLIGVLKSIISINPFFISQQNDMDEQECIKQGQSVSFYLNEDNSSSSSVLKKHLFFVTMGMTVIR